MLGPACIWKVQYKLEILWLGLVLKCQGLAGNPVAGSGSERANIGWYPVADFVLKGQVLAGNPLAVLVSERSSISCMVILRLVLFLKGPVLAGISCC
jgi:hypothetical protein